MSPPIFPPEELRQIIQEVATLLKERKETVSVAETDTIKSYSGPTPTIVSGLAEHTRKTLGSTYTVSESGTAGPTGGTTKNRTPGYVALAVARETGETVTKEVETGSSEREGNMVAFAVEGLKLLRDVLQGGSEGKL
ncbi:hypothetical protein IG631_10798 [Alternaria alternata]|nr:hypothetical protein IG631_10798 [Alternaria alternata]